MTVFRLVAFKLTVFFVVAGFFGVTIISTLDGPDVGDTDTYHAIFADVSGLHAGDPVRVSGVVVGTVEATDLLDARRVDVRFTANRNQNLTTSTYAVVRYANLLGQRFLALTQDAAPGTPLRPGATIARDHTAPAVSLTALFNGFRPLFRALDAKQVNMFSGEIIRVLQGEAGTIEDLLRQTAQLTGNLADRDKLFVSVVDNLASLLRTVSRHDVQLAQIVDSLDTLTAKLAKDTPGISRSITALDALSAQVSELVGGLNDHNLQGRVLDVSKLSSLIAANSRTLDATVKAFPVAFGAFNRVAQNGPFLNAYTCSVSMRVPIQPSVTAQQIAQTIAASLGGDASVSTILALLAGLLPGQAVPLPLDIPTGPATAAPVRNSSVCR